MLGLRLHSPLLSQVLLYLEKKGGTQNSCWLGGLSGCGRSLGGKKESLEEFLLQKLRMDESFVKEELGCVTMTRTKEPRNKNKDKFVITFESKQIRDAVKVVAPNLANHRETAGMRLHKPDHLQKEFHALMNLSFDLKKKHPGLKRNIKFDEEDFGLFMDLKLSEDLDWKKVKSAQAINANKKRRKPRTPDLDEDELHGVPA